MQRTAWIIVAGIGLTISIPTQASAQVRNFDRRQQASLQAYMNQIQARERTRTQSQFDRYSRAVDTQQSRLIDLQRRQREQDAELRDIAEDGVLDRQYRHSRGVLAFGNPHFDGRYYQRIAPYYDYNWTRTRYRTFNVVGFSNNSSNFGL